MIKHIWTVHSIIIHLYLPQISPMLLSIFVLTQQNTLCPRSTASPPISSQREDSSPLLWYRVALCELQRDNQHKWWGKTEHPIPLTLQMGTVLNLLKCCKPLSSIRFSQLANSLNTNQLRAFPSFKHKKRNLVRFFSSLSSSQPLIHKRGFSRATNNQPDSSSLDLWLYNTMSRKKELFKPKVEGKVGMYVCGITAYDLSHIGHARVYVTFDVLFRYLKHLGYEVCYVRNFTDVDDKIIARANELGENPISLSRRYCEEFHNDMVCLHCLTPSVEPRVSDHMSQIIDMIKQIIDNGCAYEIDGDVYFSVDKFPEYGRLSGRKLEDNRAGERIAINSRKKNPADFALWKVIMAWDLF